MSFNLMGYSGMPLSMYQQPGYYTPPAPAAYGNGLPYADGFKNPAYGPAAFAPYLDTGFTNSYGLSTWGGLNQIPQYQTNPNYGFALNGGLSGGFTGAMYNQGFGTGYPGATTQPYFSGGYQGALNLGFGSGFGAGYNPYAFNPYGFGGQAIAGGPPMKGQQQPVVAGGPQAVDPSLQPGYVLAPGGTPQQPQGQLPNAGIPQQGPFPQQGQFPQVQPQVQPQQQAPVMAGGQVLDPNNPYMMLSYQQEQEAAQAAAAQPQGANGMPPMPSSAAPTTSSTPPDPSALPGQQPGATPSTDTAGSPVPNFDAQTGQQQVTAGGPMDQGATIAQLQQAVAGLTQLVQQLMQLVAGQQGGLPQQGGYPSIFDQSPPQSLPPTGTDGSGVPDSLPPVAAPTPTAPTQSPVPVQGPAPVQAPVPAPAPGDFRGMARAAAQKYGMNPDIFERQIEAESGFDPKAGSPAGAQGIAQIMPGTAAEWGVDPWDPAAALDAAAKNMAKYVQNYGGDYAKALAAYNAGPGAVEQYGGVPPYAETQNYVKKILG